MQKSQTSPKSEQSAVREGRTKNAEKYGMNTETVTQKQHKVLIAVGDDSAVGI